MTDLSNYYLIHFGVLFIDPTYWLVGGGIAYFLRKQRFSIVFLTVLFSLLVTSIALAHFLQSNAPISMRIFVPFVVSYIISRILEKSKVQSSHKQAVHQPSSPLEGRTVHAPVSTGKAFKGWLPFWMFFLTSSNIIVFGFFAFDAVNKMIVYENYHYIDFKNFADTYLDQSPLVEAEWLTSSLLTVISIIIATMLCFIIRSSYLLSRIYEPRSVKTAIKTLWLTGPATMLALFFLEIEKHAVVSFFSEPVWFQSGFHDLEFIIIFLIFTSTIWALVGTIYFKDSEKVGILYNRSNTRRFITCWRSIMILWRSSPFFRKWVFGWLVWCLSCVLVLYLFEPYGSRMGSDDENHFLVVMLGIPSIISFAYYAYRKWII